MRTSTAPALLFLLVLFTGIFLRAYDWMAIPFTHDEFSALFRTGYESFSRLIQEGVEQSDVHPAGVQVFLNYWIALVGSAPYLVKLPFLLAGLGSIYLTYRLGAYWYHETTGLVAAALVASTQPMVMYSQIARPYMSGIFLVLLAVWYLSLYLNQSRPSWGPYAGWILAAIGAAYNHYFSLLTIAFIGLLGLTMVSRAQLKAYCLSGILILLGFAPHIPVTLTHLQKGGLDWLGRPETTFFWDFFRYLTHYNIVVMSLWLLLLIASLAFHFRYRKEPLDKRKRFRYLLFGALVLPAIVGYSYSVLVEPVLQFSSLMFALPLLVIGGCSFLPPLSYSFQGLVVALLLGLNTYTLIAERHHYDLHYNNRYKATKNHFLQDLKRYGKDELLPLLSVDRRLKERWQDQSPTLRNARLTRLSSLTADSLNQCLKDSHKPYLAFATPEQMNWEKWWLAKTHYPYVLKVEHFFLGQYYLMARKPHPDTVGVVTQTIHWRDKHNQNEPKYKSM